MQSRGQPVSLPLLQLKTASCSSWWRDISPHAHCSVLVPTPNYINGSHSELTAHFRSWLHTSRRWDTLCIASQNNETPILGLDCLYPCLWDILITHSLPWASVSSSSHFIPCISIRVLLWPSPYFWRFCVLSRTSDLHSSSVSSAFSQIPRHIISLQWSTDLSSDLASSSPQSSSNIQSKAMQNCLWRGLWNYSWTKVLHCTQGEIESRVDLF